MNYWTRIKICLGLSATMLVPLTMGSAHLMTPRLYEFDEEIGHEPLVLSLNRTEPDRVRRLIDSGAPAEGPVEDTDLISDEDSQAQDTSDVEGETQQPHVEESTDFDALPSPPGATASAIDPAPEQAQAPPQETPQPLVEPAPQQEETPEPVMVAAEPSEASQVESDEAPTVLLEEIEPEPESTEPAADPAPPLEPKPETPEPFQVAQAAPEPSPESDLRALRAREGGGAIIKGPLSFAAKKHEMGEYMLDIRRKVERQWRAGLQLKYTGVSRTYAIIECSIRPTGKLEFVKILEPGPSMSYAILCRDAIQQAAPFKAFPFDVPAIYRNENLEITWKFSYL